ncbi:Uma2 family endonuclease [Baaleninema simplex]|uniref:Uma2 family endonuclease n=1 Tax=Baaleninema simplex TaxID=2862350 RepID=UPI000348BBD2|nr:Uma2 family endonuclease [Baaleninema simplex]
MSRGKQVASKLVPILESGDRLSRVEFEKRYHGMPYVKKAELVEGVVYVASPVRMGKHANPHARVITWLGVYEAIAPSVTLGDNATVRLDSKNEVQPDALLRLDASAGGQSRISEDDYLEGAPELIVEIAASTASYDLHDKLRAYRRNGVREYLVWVVLEEEFRWYVLEEGEYRQQEPDAAGCLSSPFFLGLALDVKALLAGEMGQVLARLQTGLGS